jgi:hypothetical protein
MVSECLGSLIIQSIALQDQEADQERGVSWHIEMTYSEELLFMFEEEARIKVSNRRLAKWDKL